MQHMAIKTRKQPADVADDQLKYIMCTNERLVPPANLGQIANCRLTLLNSPQLFRVCVELPQWKILSSCVSVVFSSSRNGTETRKCATDAGRVYFAPVGLSSLFEWTISRHRGKLTFFDPRWL